MYEYGVMWRGLEDDGPHRTGMTRTEAQEWIDEFYECAPGAKEGLVYVIRRKIGEWEPYE